MYLTVHRVKAASFRKLFGRQYRCADWVECYWSPRPFLVIPHGDKGETIWTQSEAIEIEVPPWSDVLEVELPRNGKVTPAVEPARRRLCVPGDKWGLDPRSVLHKAESEEDGFRVVLPVPGLVGAEEAETTDIPPDGMSPLPTEETAMIGKIRITSSGYDPNGPRVNDPTLGTFAASAAARWGIAYGSLQCHPDVDDRSFVSKRAAARIGPLGTTTRQAEMASWPDSAGAWGAMLELGLDPAVPASANPGLNHLFPTVAPIPDASYRPRCGAFELNALAELPTAPAPELPRPVPTAAASSSTLPGQLAFSW